MPTVIQDGTGSGFDAKVDIANRLFVTGSITSMPAVTVTAAADPATTKVGAAGLGSASLVGAYDGVNDVQALRIINGSHLLVAGSISSMPTISVAADPSTTKVGDAGLGSASLIGGYDGADDVQAGRITNGSYFMTTGSITSIPRIGISGNEMIGSVVISSAPLIGISGAIFDSGDIVGSVVISSATKLGVSGIVEVSNDVQVAGSIWSIPNISVDPNPSTTEIGGAGLGSATLIGGYDFEDNVQPFRIDNGSHLLTAGSIVTMPSVVVSATDLDIRDLSSVSDSVGVVGSVRISAPPLGVSGTIFDDGNLIGSFHPAGIGSVIIKSSSLVGVSGLIFTDGNMTGSMAMKGIGSVIVSSSNLIGVSGAIFDSGDITGSVVISSASLIGVSGLIFTDGNITGSMAMKGIGSVIISSSNLVGVSGAIFDSGDIVGSVVISSSTLIGVSGDIFTGGSIKVSAPSDNYITRVDYSGALNVPIYVGLAAPGTAVDAANWQLKQINYHTNSLVSGVLFGSGNTNFDKKWTERDDGGAEYS